jgi:hypothetical protein
VVFGCGPYRRVEAHELDDQVHIDSMATYVLAQDRIRGMTN